MQEQLPAMPIVARERGKTIDGESKIIEAGKKEVGMARPHRPHRHFPHFGVALLAAAGLAGPVSSKADMLITDKTECPAGYTKTGQLVCTNDKVASAKPVVPAPTSAVPPAKLPAKSAPPAPAKSGAKPKTVLAAVDKPTKKSVEERLTNLEDTLPIVADGVRGAEKNASIAYKEGSEAKDAATEAKKEAGAVHDALDMGVAPALVAQSQRIDKQDLRLAKLESGPKEANVEVAAMPGLSVHNRIVNPAFAIYAQYVPHGWTAPGFVVGIGAGYAQESKNVPQYKDGDRLISSIPRNTFGLDGEVGFRVPVVKDAVVMQATIGPTIVISHQPDAIIAKGNDGGTYGIKGSDTVRLAASGSVSALFKVAGPLYTGVSASGRLYTDGERPVWTVAAPIGVVY